MNKKRIYEYKRVSLNIPRRFHKAVEPFLDKQLQMKMIAKDNAITITLNLDHEEAS